MIVQNLGLLRLSTKEGKIKVQSQRIERGTSANSGTSALDSPPPQGKSFLYYRGQRVYASDTKDAKGYRYILLFGKVELKISEQTLKADSVILKVDSQDIPVEAIAEGDLLLIDGAKNTLTGSKILVYPQIHRSEIFDMKFYKKPFFVFGRNAKQVARNKYIIDRGFVTTDTQKDTHWKLWYTRAWMYNYQFLYAENTIYEVGATPLVYLPFFFRLDIETGIRTSFGYERGVEWFVNNTFVFIPGRSIGETRKLAQVQANSALTLPAGEEWITQWKLDYYQRLGLYAGGEVLYKSGLHEFLFDSALAVDRSLRYNPRNSDLVENYFDQDGDGIPEETHNFRWRVKSKGALGIVDSQYFQSVLNASFQRQGEPYFQGQFEKRRKVDFDLYELARREDTKPEITGISGQTLGIDQGQKIHVALQNKVFKDLTLGLSAHFDYALQHNKTNPRNIPQNPYRTNFYTNYKYIFTVPEFNGFYPGFLSLFGDYLPESDEDKKQKQKTEKDRVREFLKVLDSNIVDPEDNKSTTEETKKTLPTGYHNPKVERKNKFIMNLPLIYSVSSQVPLRRYYATGANNKLLSEILSSQNVLSLRLPFTSTYSFLQFDSSVEQLFNYASQKTKNASSAQVVGDREQTFGGWETRLSSGLKFYFFEMYEYLEVRFGGGVNYTKKNRFDPVVRKDNTFYGESHRSETWGMEAFVYFLKTEYKVSFTNNIHILQSEYLRIQEGNTTKAALLHSKKGNIAVSMRSDISEFLILSTNATFSQQQRKWLSNSLTVGYKILNSTHLFGFVFVDQLKHEFVWQKDFLVHRNDSLSSVFTLDINIGPFWKFLLVASSSNKSLFRYTEEGLKYGYAKRDFFKDLVDSFNFFDSDARKRSLFKLQSLDFSIRHDLHSWMMEVGVELRLQRFRDKDYYFQPRIYFNLFVKEFKSFRYPKVNHTFSRH